MIEASERSEWAEQFGVAIAQVSRDHYISHLLRALGELHANTHFFGGTALCRTYLDRTRLSEDIDLLHPTPSEFLATLQVELPRAIRREFPGSEWSRVSVEGDGRSCSIGSPSVEPIKVFVGRYEAASSPWEFSPTRVRLRYSDLPTDQMFQCPTLSTFAAMKLAAWCDRFAPRDLYDLAGLAALGVLRNPNVERILEAKTGVSIPTLDFSRIPDLTAAAWDAELGAQVGQLPRAQDCLARVRAALTDTNA